MKRNFLLFFKVFASLILVQIFSSATTHAGDLLKVVESGSFEPGGAAQYSIIGASPALNDLGQITFNSDLRSNGFLQGYGVYLATGTNITTLARVGQPAPDFNGNLYSFYTFVALNDTSQVFQANLRGTLGGNSDSTGIFQLSSGILTQLARGTETTPDGGGVFKSLDNVPVRINRAGQTAFECSTSTRSSEIYRSSGSNLTRMATYNEASPDGNGTLNGVGNPTLNNNGQVAFYAGLAGTNGSVQGFLRSDGNALTLLARIFQTVPNGNGYFQSFRSSEPTFNDSGQIAFESILSGTSGGTTDNNGLYRSDGVTITELARKGQFVPGGNGRLLDFGNTSEVAINNDGTVAFLADLTGTTGGTSDNAAIYVTSATNIIQMARKGQTAPDGNGVFSTFGYPAINNRGEVAFSATLTGTKGGSTDTQGIFLVEPSLAIHQIVRSGLIVDGENLTEPAFLDGPNYGGLSGLNNNGQMTFRAALNGNYGVFLWSPPDITALTRVGDDMIITLQTVGGTTNFIQGTPDLGSNFIDLTNVIISDGNLVITNVLDPGGATNASRFYRIRQLP